MPLQAFKLKAMTEHELVKEAQAKGCLSEAAAIERIAKARAVLPADADNETIFVKVCELLTEVA